MPSQKNTSLLAQHSLESYKEQARLHRAASKLRASSLSSRAVGKPDGKERSELAEVAILKDGGRVTVLLGKARPITDANKAEVLGKSDLSIPEFKAEKNSMLSKVNRKR
jgi:hypothetical protein